MSSAPSIADDFESDLVATSRGEVCSPGFSVFSITSTGATKSVSPYSKDAAGFHVGCRSKMIKAEQAKTRRTRVACKRCRLRKIRCSGEPAADAIEQRCCNCVKAQIQPDVCVFRRVGTLDSETAREAVNPSETEFNVPDPTGTSSKIDAEHIAAQALVELFSGKSGVQSALESTSNRSDNAI